jgi:serine/threonine protein phosphatase 1
MEQISLQPEDTLYVLGDVIDRHPYGIEILEIIMETPNIKTLLGNHEYMMLNAIYPQRGRLPWHRETGWRNTEIWFNNGGEVTKNAFNKLSQEQKDKIFDYLKTRPLSSALISK